MKNNSGWEKCSEEAEEEWRTKPPFLKKESKIT